MSIDKITKTLDGFRLTAQFQNVPVSFVNGLRRILLSELPVVVLRDIEIVTNTSDMIQEMLHHRLSMLPINCLPDDMATIRDTKIELRYPIGVEKDVRVTTDDFVVNGPKKNVFLKDRDLDTPLPLLTLKKGQVLHIRASLGILTGSSGVSQVCVSTFQNSIDEDMAKLDKDTYTLSKGGDPRVFDNFEIQRSYIRDSNGRPTHFDMTIESVGVVKAKVLLEMALKNYKERIEAFCVSPITSVGENRFLVETTTESHTILALAQSMLYSAGLVDWVSYSCEHPLLETWMLSFTTKVDAEVVLKRFKTEAVALCERILTSI